jgi:hypothetical protein
MERRPAADTCPAANAAAAPDGTVAAVRTVADRVAAGLARGRRREAPDTSGLVVLARLRCDVPTSGDAW